MPSISLKFTNRALRKIKTPKGKKLIIHSDKVIQGLRGRKSSSGRVTLYVEQKFKNQSLKITIGVFPYLSVREARKKAIELKTLMANGIDPREVRRQQKIEENEKRLKSRQDITFKQLYDKYEEYSKIYNTNSKGSTARIHIVIYNEVCV